MEDLAGPGGPDGENGTKQRRTVMRGAVMYAPGHVEVIDRTDPKIVAPTWRDHVDDADYRGENE
jgi:hypothetical protein